MQTLQSLRKLGQYIPCRLILNRPTVIKMSSTLKRKSKEEFIDDESVDEEEKPSSAKKQTPIAKTNSTEDFYVDLGSNKRATVSQYKGKVLINLREFYEDKSTGEMKPGSKGLALTIDQWLKLTSNIDSINKAIDDY